PSPAALKVGAADHAVTAFRGGRRCGHGRPSRPRVPPRTCPQRPPWDRKHYSSNAPSVRTSTLANPTSGVWRCRAGGCHRSPGAEWRSPRERRILAPMGAVRLIATLAAGALVLAPSAASGAGGLFDYDASAALSVAHGATTTTNGVVREAL